MHFKKNTEETSEVDMVEPCNSETNDVDKTSLKSEDDLKTMYLNAISDMCNIIDSQINILQKLKDSMSRLSNE